MVEDTTEVTRLLKAWSGGDQAALDALIPKVYLELRKIARRHMRAEKAGNSFQATALVHEVYLRLVDVKSVAWQDRAHFFAVSANMMRRILVDRARAKGSSKRVGPALQLNLEHLSDMPGGHSRGIMAVDQALYALADLDPRKARVVELRFFGGLSVEETAEVLKISTISVHRDWKFARAWLLAELQPRV